MCEGETKFFTFFEETVVYIKKKKRENKIVCK